jgi:hypothetical protein
MTDHIFYDILYSTEDDYEEARELLHRILSRDLYKVVAYKNCSAEMLKKKVYTSVYNPTLNPELNN